MSFDFKTSVLTTNLNFPKRQGKVRDVYDIGDRLLIVSSDRISAFDWVLPVGIPGKGIVLNQLSRFWFQHLKVDHHLISTEVPLDLPLDQAQRAQLLGRTMITRKAQVIPFECRPRLSGRFWLA
ncbi:MAG: phosphoribosylaminoimidazolesuccinocarboxamide synthase [Pirellulales bacterium]